jgi:Zn-dependent metalloprotease
MRLTIPLACAFSTVATSLGAAEISRVSPNVLPPGGGTLVTVYGDGFVRGDVARINGVALARVTFVDSRRLSGWSPALPPGEYTVDVVAGRGIVKARLADAVTVQAPDGLEAALARLGSASQAPLVSIFRNGFPRFLSGRFPVGGSSLPAKSQEFLKRYGSLFGLDQDGIGLHFRRAASEDLDSMYFTQTYMGIPVHGASLLVGLKGDEVLFTIGKMLLPARRLHTTPRITSAEAIAAARQALGNLRLPLAADPTLMILDLGLLTDSPSEPNLAWRVILGRSHPYRLFIDAGRGTVLLKQSLLEDNGSSLHGFDLDVEDAEEEANAQEDGCFVLSSDTEVATESWFSSDYLGDPDAVMARNAAREAYRYFHTQFNWHSYNNDASEINVFIHADTEGGAQWVPTCDLIQVETGRPSMDTLAHELTHGIIRRGSDLDYEFQSGALNEHYADAMACIADRMREGAGADWTHAEDRTSGQGKVRDFADPTTTGQPDHMSGLDYQWNDEEDENDDNGGVHFNSGIPNKALFLMVEGGSHGGYAAPGGLSLTKAARVKWMALRYLPSDASFLDARNYEVTMATYCRDNDLYGFTADDVCAIKIAWAAVGVGQQAGPTCNGQSIVDTDGDGVANSDDNCDTVSNPLQQNLDWDFLGDACDPDIDNDGFPNGSDSCPTKYNPPQGPCDDYDNDGVKDNVDNCKFDPNPSQVDSDQDGEGNACEVDTDLDGVNAPEDNCPLVPNTNQQDTDDDGFGDACDDCPNDADPIWAYGLDGMPFQPDSDEDGIPDACDTTSRVNGVPGGILGVSHDGGSSQVDVEVSPGRIVRLPIDICPGGCPEWIAPGQVLDLEISGLDPNVLIYISDEEGKAHAKSPRGPHQGTLRFVPRGEGRYYLNLEVGTRYVGDLLRLAATLLPNAEPELPPAFRRGDSNTDGKVDISDALRTLAFLFLGASELDCKDAADANDDNKLDISDGIFVLTYLFVGGAPLPDPGPQNCGQDPTDSIGCDSYEGC